MSFPSFQPPLRTLLGPGPSEVHPRVLQACARPTLGHLDPAFLELMDQIKIQLQELFGTKNALTFPVSAPGSAGMEACFVNLVEAGDKVIIGANGVFSLRMRENVLRCGGIPIMVETAWGKSVEPGMIEDACRQNPDAKILAFVHAETSTGALSDAAALAQIARQNSLYTIMDAVTSLGGTPLTIDKWGIDAVYSGSQKCLSCIAGLSPVSFSERALEKIKQRNSPVQSWFLDMNLIMDYWKPGSKRSYHHTAPINSLYALHESLVMHAEEGAENVFARHQRVHLYLIHQLATQLPIQLKIFVEEKDRMPQLNAIAIPDHLKDTEANFRANLLTKYGIEIGGGLGPLAGAIWRVGLMGHGAREKNVDYLVHALRDLLS
jgi:alanine-glyoxylate transaminase/serine-glyoxylate transaminase/serine-pyruvate transaminase